MNGRTKLTCYLAVAALTALTTQLENFDSNELPDWTWVGWARFGAFIALQIFITLRAFLDQTLSKTTPEVITKTNG